ncbi:MAG: ATP-dependent DNA helicase [Propionibacteriaceae bacterium]|jgi:ATP-dependent DNA helicase DinG|nr:ATP-dependent DNA helicase [Propionibacteriaceae bacterium]
MPDEPVTSALLSLAVARIGGAPRAGQEQMAALIDEAFEDHHAALIQAGTGTGKSLGYLAPLVAYLNAHPDLSGVVATATLALQTQLANKDIPTIMAAAEQLGLAPLRWCVLKGSANYPCLLKIREAPADPGQRQYALDEVEVDDVVDADSPLGDQVVALRLWAEEQCEQGVIADRDDAPRHSARAWAQIAVSGRECVGPNCPYADQCFVFAAREKAATSQLVVTNHALVAIEAAHGWAMLNPDVLVLDEAHDLAARVTTSQTDELSPHMVDRAVRMAATVVSEATRDALVNAASHFAWALDDAEPGRARGGAVLDAVAELRSVMRQAVTAIGHDNSDARREQIALAVKQTFDVCDRIGGQDDADVVWVSVRPQYGPQLVVAPLRVQAAIRNTILDHQTTILTSATLKLGDSFQPLATTVGLTIGDPVAYVTADVGSPFDYQRQGICYVAKHLPRPGRDGISQAALDEIAALIRASDGHALGLFSSLRAAEAAAEHVRDVDDRTVLLQGEGHLPDLISRFIAAPKTSLFGTLSLWQGVDAPGQTCHLVIVDRIPFPRPDEPLTQARQEDISRHGGNGFMSVAAAQAGLMLAQGTGRLIRTMDDKGVIAILDPRLLTARYGPFLTSSMPPWWMTTDPEVARSALERLSGRRDS